MANTISTSLQENIVIGATEALSQSMALVGQVQLNASSDPGNKGESWNVGEYDDRTATDVTAANVSPDGTAATFGAKTVTLGYQKKANFKLTGREFSGNNLDQTVMNQIQECVRAVMYSMNASLWSLYTKIPYVVGNSARSIFSDGTNPSIDPLADVQKVLNDNLVGPNRSLIVGTTEYANAMKVSALQNANTFGGVELIRGGYIPNVMGFKLFMDQQAASQTSGTITGALIAKAATAQAAGLTSIVATTAASSGAIALVVGDVVTIGGAQYSIQTAVTGADSADVTLVLDRGIETALVGSEAIALATGYGDGVFSLAGDFSGFGLMSR